MRSLGVLALCVILVGAGDLRGQNGALAGGDIGLDEGNPRSLGGPRVPVLFPSLLEPPALEADLQECAEPLIRPRNRAGFAVSGIIFGLLAGVVLGASTAGDDPADESEVDRALRFGMIGSASLGLIGYAVARALPDKVVCMSEPTP